MFCPLDSGFPLFSVCSLRIHNEKFVSEVLLRTETYLICPLLHVSPLVLSRDTAFSLTAVVIYVLLHDLRFTAQPACFWTRPVKMSSLTHSTVNNQLINKMSPVT